MTRLHYLILGFLLIFNSPVFPQASKNDIREIPFTDTAACSCVFPEFYFFNRTAEFTE